MPTLTEVKQAHPSFFYRKQQGGTRKFTIEQGKQSNQPYLVLHNPKHTAAIIIDPDTLFFGQSFTLTSASLHQWLEEH